MVTNFCHVQWCFVDLVLFTETFQGCRGKKTGIKLERKQYSGDILWKQSGLREQKDLPLTLSHSATWGKLLYF